jgi:hypothetical protein
MKKDVDKKTLEKPTCYKENKCASCPYRGDCLNVIK